MYSWNDFVCEQRFGRSRYISVNVCDERFPVALGYLALVVVGTAEQCPFRPIPVVPSISFVVVDVQVLVGCVDVDDVVVGVRVDGSSRWLLMKLTVE